MKRNLLCMGFMGALMLLNSTLGTAQTFITIGHATQPPELFANASTDVTICNGNNTVLTSTPTGGTGTYSYAWTPGATLSSTTNDTTTATPTANQTYTITVVDDRNCTATDNVAVTVVDCSGLDEIKEIQAMNLYPNPSDGNINIGIEFKTKPQSVLVQIFNMNGQLVLTKNYNKPGIELKDNYNLTNQAAGNYLMRITVGANSLAKSFIIK